MLVMREREGIAALGFVPRVLPAHAGDLRVELVEWSWQAEETHPSAVLRVELAGLR